MNTAVGLGSEQDAGGSRGGDVEGAQSIGAPEPPAVAARARTARAAALAPHCAARDARHHCTRWTARRLLGTEARAAGGGGSVVCLYERYHELLNTD